MQAIKEIESPLQAPVHCWVPSLFPSFPFSLKVTEVGTGSAGRHVTPPSEVLSAVPIFRERELVILHS